MKMNLKTVAAAVALACAAATAHADAISAKPSSGDSSLVLTVFDQSSGKSYFSAIGGAGTLSSVNTGTFTLAGLANFFSTSDPANLFWSVVAGDSTLAPGNDFVFGQRLLTTSLNGPAVGGSINGQMPGIAAANLETFDHNACGTVAAGAACTANSSGDPTSAAQASWNADFGGTGVLSGTSIASATSMALYLVTADSSLDEFSAAFTSNPVAVKTAYTAAINLAAGTLAITSGSTPEVPLPAAVWLFGSALGAMGIIGRRKRPLAA